jgi:4-aminobutyrate aminotransferase-like enzyme
MSTTASQFFGSSRIQELLQTLRSELTEAGKKISGIRPPNAALSVGYKTFIDHLNTIRGRNLYYPYVGSGMGYGPYVELMDGSVKLDLINGIGIHLFGHSHPELVEAGLRGAMQDVVMQGNLQPNGEYAELLDILLKAAGRNSRLRRGWIGTCGTIVNENALKISRQKNSPARKILAMENQFAGRSTLMAEITDNPEYRVGLPKYDEVLYVPFYNKNDPASAEKSLAVLKKHIADNPKNIACFVFELIQGEGGFNIAPPSYFKALFDVCREHHIAIWADEVQTFARTGELFAFEALGLGDYIDIVTIAKTIQCGAVLYTEEYNPKPGLIAGTFTAASVSLATGIASLKMLLGEKGVKYLGPQGRVQAIHRDFTAMLEDLKKGSCKGLIQDINGIGLMVAMTPYDGSKEKTGKLLQNLFNNGLIAFSCGHGPFKVRFLLPSVLEAKHIAEAKTIIEKSLRETQ